MTGLKIFKTGTPVKAGDHKGIVVSATIYGDNIAYNVTYNVKGERYNAEFLDMEVKAWGEANKTEIGFK